MIHQGGLGWRVLNFRTERGGTGGALGEGEKDFFTKLGIGFLLKFLRLPRWHSLKFVEEMFLLRISVNQGRLYTYKYPTHSQEWRWGGYTLLAHILINPIRKTEH